MIFNLKSAMLEKYNQEVLFQNKYIKNTFQKTDNGWRELLIDIDGQDKLYYRISAEANSAVRTLIRPPLDSGDRTELEISARSLSIARQLAHRVDQFGGLALIADYGHEGEKGDTFRVSFYIYKNHKIKK